MWILPLIATTVSIAFSGVILRQYRQRGKPYQLAWGTALAMFALASGSELIAAIWGWTPLLIRTYYLFGATLVVGYLALGTVWLMTGPRAAKFTLAILGILSVLAAVSVAGAPIATDALHQGYQAMERPALLRGIAISLNSLGTLVVVGGALWSAGSYLRTRTQPERAAANGLIALGVMVVATGGTLAGLLQLTGPEAISLTNALGVTIMFAGVLQADRRPAKQQAGLET